MKTQRWLTALTLVNLGILILLSTQIGPARRADGSLLETSGKVYPEVVLFRLIRPDGRPSVKIETSEQGSGLDLGGGADPSYIVLKAEGADTSISVTNKEGRQQVVKP
jgi:hypothetical protein